MKLREKIKKKSLKQILKSNNITMQTNFKTLRLFLEFLNEHQEIIISFLEALKLCKGKKKKE